MSTYIPRYVHRVARVATSSCVALATGSLAPPAAAAGGLWRWLAWSMRNFRPEGFSGPQAGLMVSFCGCCGCYSKLWLLWWWLWWLL
ncbi:hypothetical protein BZA05DRAFT_406889 [Tricharina praecox]|uniref:uncharacterized protein n=1 Tax=Tricharina praecox TaxID=43433 RepID=UPI002220A2B5|nr:uncharacterized protein BZA05DRAFT_406889 [Tricharina praecox]KAI5846074.1 hypothetical protein BZA05DRAFT_406889 [Tricharina praecox]